MEAEEGDCQSGAGWERLDQPLLALRMGAGSKSREMQATSRR